jgi:gamma-glutamylcyclotransferase (GGCT)/AIG2-like uncharacterized protein YtfP
MSEYLFAYGTLKPGQSPPEIAPALERLTPVGMGFVHGLLYALGDFPGAVLDPASKNKILGTVFKLPDDPSVLRQLDEYEEYDPTDRETSLFIRERHPVALVSGSRLECWIYVYNGKSTPRNIVEDGIFQKEAV